MSRTSTTLACLFLASCKLGDCGGSAGRADASAAKESADDPRATATSEPASPGEPATGPIDCSHASGYCPGDDPPTASVRDRCVQSLEHPKCGAAFRAFQECLRDKSKCDASGRSNLSATTAQCRPALEAFSACQDLNESRPRARPM